MYSCRKIYNQNVKSITTLWTLQKCNFKIWFILWLVFVAIKENFSSEYTQSCTNTMTILLRLLMQYKSTVNITRHERMFLSFTKIAKPPSTFLPIKNNSREKPSYYVLTSNKHGTEHNKWRSTLELGFKLPALYQMRQYT